MIDLFVELHASVSNGGYAAVATDCDCTLTVQYIQMVFSDVIVNAILFWLLLQGQASTTAGIPVSLAWIQLSKE